ncbi:MAG: SseB family protein [Brevundimonas sp.]|nr:SseB family protein [Brevundimonas sp.]
MRAALVGLGCALLACAPTGVAAQSIKPHQDRAPDSPLEELLQGAVHGRTPPRTFEAAFMEQKVYLRITPESYTALQAARGADGRLTAQTPIQLWVVTSETPSPLAPMFTSEAAFRRTYPEHPWISVTGRQALELIKAPTAVRVGDGDGHMVTWTVAEIGLLQARYPDASTR